jgi:hypothetical protein
MVVPWCPERGPTLRLRQPPVRVAPGSTCANGGYIDQSRKRRVSEEFDRDPGQ